MNLKDAIDQFTSWRKFKVKKETVRGYDRELRNFCLFLKYRFGRYPEIEEVTLHHVMDYLNGMEEMGWDRNSFVGKTMALRKFFEFWRLQGYQSVNEELIPIPDKEPKLPRVADEEHYRKLVAAIPAQSNDPRHIRNMALVNLLWDTGARNGELCMLNVSELDTENKRALIKTEKSKTRRPFREIFWTDETNDNLIRWVKKRQALEKKMDFKDKDALFVSLTSWKSGERFTIRGVGEMLRRYSNKAKLPYMNAHSFRHHRGHHIIKQGGSTADVMNILGHASVQSTTIYTMMRGRELEERARLFLPDGPKQKARQTVKARIGASYQQ